MKKIVKQYWRATDKPFLLACLLCSVLSVLTLVSQGAFQLGGFETDPVSGAITGLGGYSRAMMQAVASLLGLTAAIFLSRLDYEGMVDFWPVHSAVTWGLVLPTLFLHNVKLGFLTIGYDAGGTDNYSWYRVGGITFQPTELAKISFILTLAMLLDTARDRVNQPHELLRILAAILVPVAVIHVQGDDGTAIVFACIGLAMLFAAGLSWKYLAWAGALTATAAAVVLGFFRDRVLKSYQFARIMAVVYPNDPTYARYTYQQNRGVTSIGAGRILGRGLFGTEHNSVPNAWNDFIFSYMAEAFGFVGTLFVLGLLFFITFRTLNTALRSEGRAGGYICVGVFAAFFFQIVINLGMNLQILPVIGVTLPFFSAGGSSVLMLYLSVGLVLSVYIHNKKNLFTK